MDENRKETPNDFEISLCLDLGKGLGDLEFISDSEILHRISELSKGMRTYNNVERQMSYFSKQKQNGDLS